mgnify:CR=1 FL=1
MQAEVGQRDSGADQPVPTRADTVTGLIPYIENEMARGVRMHQITRHILGLYHGQPRARAWRRHLSEVGVRAESGVAVLREALEIVEGETAFAVA